MARLKSADLKSTFFIVVSLRFTLANSDHLKSAPLNLAPARSVTLKLVHFILEPLKLAPLNLAAAKLAPFRLELLKLSFSVFIELKLAFRKSSSFILKPKKLNERNLWLKVFSLALSISIVPLKL